MDTENPCPIPENQVENVGRRRFLSVAAGAVSAVVAAAVAAPLVGMLLDPLFAKRKQDWLGIGKLQDAPVGVPSKFTYSYVRTDGWLQKTVYGSAYVVRDASGGFFVLSNICTHLGCGVRWDPSRNAFVCPCHNGVFASDGRVLSGPPPKPLNRLQSRAAQGIVEIRIEEAG